jgi:DNA-dependent RNA polymerase auxiliary subunit epsilon
MNLKFYKPIIYYSFLFLSVFFLVLVNNYYFYQHVKADSRREIITLAKQLQTFSTFYKYNKNKCLEQIEILLKNAPTHYGTLVNIKDNNNQMLLSYDSRKYIKISDSTAMHLSHLDKNLQKLEFLDATLEITKNPVPNILISTIKSLTFSISDWIIIWKEKGFKEVTEYWKKVAWPRSRPALFYFLFVSFITWLGKRVEESKEKLIYEFENKENEHNEQKDHFNEINKELIDTKNKLKKLKEDKDYNLELISLYEEEIAKKEKEKEKDHINEINKELIDTKNKLKKLKEDKDYNLELISKHEEEIAKKEKEKDQLNKTLKELEAEINKLEPDVEKYAEDNNLSTNKIKKILLENPNVTKSNNKKMTSNKGKHHSKMYAKVVIKRLEEDKTIKDYIYNIHACAYNSNKRGIILISKNQNHYKANMYDKKDEGYGVEIIFSSTTLYDTISLAKYINNSISFFKNYKIEIDKKLKIM